MQVGLPEAVRVEVALHAHHAGVVVAEELDSIDAEDLGRLGRDLERRHDVELLLAAKRHARDHVRTVRVLQEVDEVRGLAAPQAVLLEQHRLPEVGVDQQGPVVVAREALGEVHGHGRLALDGAPAGDHHDLR